VQDAVLFDLLAEQTERYTKSLSFGVWGKELESYTFTINILITEIQLRKEKSAPVIHMIPSAGIKLEA
jgi:hypothetical protein